MSSSTFEKLNSQKYNKLTDSEGPSNQVSSIKKSVTENPGSEFRATKI